MKKIEKTKFKKLLKEPAPKVIVADSHSRCRVIENRLGREYKKLANVRFISIEDLPAYLAGIPDLKIPDRRQFSNIIYEAAGAVIGSGSYFSEYKEKPRLFALLGNVIKEILASGIDPAELKKLHNREKWKEIVSLTEKIKELYAGHNFISPDEVLERALENADKKTGQFYFITNLILTAPRKKIMDTLSRKNDVYNLPSGNNSGGGLSEAIEKGEKVEKGADSVEFMAYPHPSEEIRGILNKALYQGRGGNTAIGLASYTQNIVKLKTEADKRGIKITCGRGLPLSFFSCVRLFLSFLRLAENQKRVRPVRDIINSSSLEGAKEINRRLCREIVSEHKKNRDMESFHKYLSSGASDEYKKERYKDQVEFLEEFSKDTEKILKKINLGGEYKSRPFLEIIDKFITSHSESEAGALKILKDLLKNLEEDRYFLNDPAPVWEGIKERIIDKMTAGSAPDGESLYISDVEDVSAGGFETVIYANLSQGNFSPTLPADPIFLYPERDRFNSMAGEKVFEDRDLYPGKIRGKFLEMVRGTGKKIFSWTANDSLTGKSVMPSPYLFELYRAIKGKSAGTTELEEYANLKRSLPAVKGFIDSSPRALGVFPNIRRYREVLKNRKTPDINEFAGYIKDRSIKKNLEEKTYSPSQLSNIIRCPAGYMFEKVFRLKIEDFSETDPFTWIDRLQWGSIIHEILTLFYRKVKKDSSKENSKELLKTGEEVLHKFSQSHPPPTVHFHKGTQNRVNKLLRHFYSHGIEFKEGFHPEYFEVRTGVPDHGDTDPDLHSEDSVEVNFGTSALRIRGIIDRVDRDSKGRYLLIDYKTGKYKLDDKNAFVARSFIQHVIYPILFKKAYTEKLDIKSVLSAYYFCTYRGEFKSKLYDEKELKKERETYEKIIHGLITMIRSGKFPQNQEVCEYCDYSNVCPRQDLESPRGETEKYRKVVEEKQYDS